MKKSIRQIAAMLAVLLVLTACGTHAEIPNTGKTVCVVLKAMDSVHWMSVKDGLNQAANDYHIEINILWPEHEDDVEAQNKILYDVIASKPDAIAFAPCDSKNIGGLKTALDQGIPCFYIDTKGEWIDCPYIGSDNYRIGEVAAQKIAETISDGSVAVITGSQDQSTHKERTKGFVEYIREHTTLTVCKTEEAPNSNNLESMVCMQAILEENPDVKAVFCTSAMMVLGAMQQRNSMERQDVVLVGVDTQSDAMTAVEKGDILAIVGQNGYQIGYRTVETIVQSLEGNEIEQEVYIDNPLITQDNIEQYWEQYSAEQMANKG